MTTLVTGSSGFVGSALCRSLAERGMRVRPSSRQGAAFRLPELAGDAVFGAILDGVDAVVHAAARVHAPLGIGSEDACRRVNVDGTLALARQAAAAGVRRFVFLSSIKVNGESTQPGRHFTAGDVPSPADAYARSKADAEAGLLALAARSAMEVTVIRPPLVYGPGVGANFRRMMQWLASGMPLPFGAIRDNRRSLLALDNLVDLIVTCIEHPGAANRVLLAADGEDLSTVELLRRLGAAMRVPVRLVPVPAWMLHGAATLCGRGDEMRRLCGSLQVDCAATREALGWRPVVGVDEGLRRAAAWFRELRPSGS